MESSSLNGELTETKDIKNKRGGNSIVIAIKNFYSLYGFATKILFIAGTINIIFNWVQDKLEITSASFLIFKIIVLVVFYSSAYYFLIESLISKKISETEKDKITYFFDGSKKGFRHYVIILSLTTFLILLWAFLLIVPAIIYTILYPAFLYFLLKKEKTTN